MVLAVIASTIEPDLSGFHILGLMSLGYTNILECIGNYVNIFSAMTIVTGIHHLCRM